MALDEGKPLSFEKLLRTMLAVTLRKLRFVIEQLQLRRAAGHVQEDDLLRTWPKMSHMIRQLTNRGFNACGTPGAISQQRSQRYAAQADMALPQKVPPRDAVQVFVTWIHFRRVGIAHHSTRITWWAMPTLR
jgi:hypothetical protein